MKRAYIYGGLVLLALTFVGGFLAGRAGGEPPRLSEISLARLRLRADELRANVAAAVASREEAHAKAPAAAARAKALAAAAGVAPDVVVGFDLRPAATPGEDSGMVEVAAAHPGDPCLPEDFAVSGTVQRLGGTWTLDALLEHRWAGEVVWRYPLHGKVSVYDESLRPERRWFAGATYDSEREVGGLLGRQWDGFAVMGGLSRERAWVGAAVRW